MSPSLARALRPGDAVHWTDPDAGLCSRSIVILEVTVEGDDDLDPAVAIIGQDGSELECFASELSPVRP